MPVATEKFSAKEAAIQLSTDARTLRKFLRSSPDFDAVGQGNRYEFTKGQMKLLKKAFVAWSSGSKTKKQTKISTEMTDEELTGLPTKEIDDTDENGFSDEDYAEHQNIDLDDYDGTTAELETLEPDEDDLADIEDEIEEVDLDIE